jgi:hypothetical protein
MSNHRPYKSYPLWLRKWFLQPIGIMNMIHKDSQSRIRSHTSKCHLDHKNKNTCTIQQDRQVTLPQAKIWETAKGKAHVDPFVVEMIFFTR